MGKGGGATKGAVGEGRIKGGGKKEKKREKSEPSRLLEVRAQTVQ